MNYNKEESLLFDFLNSFELIDSFQKDINEETVFKGVVDDTYLSTINMYIEEIKSKSGNIKKFIINDNNLLIKLFFYFKSNFIENFLEKLELLDKEEFIKIIKVNMPIIDDKKMDSIENLDISPADKWNLLYIIENFEVQRDILIKDLAENHKIYLKYYSYLYDINNTDYDDVFEFVQNKNQSYDMIFSNLIEKEVFFDINKIYILPIGINFLNILYDKHNKTIAIGLYVVKYYKKIQALEKLRKDQFFEIIKAISDPTRYSILKYINYGIYSNSVIAERLDLTRAAISRQVKYLIDCRVLLLDKDTKIYSINYELIKKSLRNIERDFDL